MNMEEKKRGQRLFGNLLGQLNKFSKEEKEAAKSARVSTGPSGRETITGWPEHILFMLQVKAREEIAARVASKIQGETKRVHEISEHEKGVRSARHEYERVQTVLREAELEVSTERHSTTQLWCSVLIGGIGLGPTLTGQIESTTSPSGLAFLAHQFDMG